MSWDMSWNEVLILWDLSWKHYFLKKETPKGCILEMLFLDSASKLDPRGVSLKKVSKIDPVAINNLFRDISCRCFLQKHLRFFFSLYMLITLTVLLFTTDTETDAFPTHGGGGTP